MQPCFSWTDSRQRLNIRLHHACDAADLRTAPQLFHARPVLAAEFAERLKRDIKADLVSKLEAVGHCFCSAIDTNRDPFDSVLFYAALKGSTRKAHDAQRRISDRGPPRFLVNPNPYFKGILCRQLVESKGGQEADNSAWHSLRRLDEAVLFRQIGVRQRVQAAPNPLKFSPPPSTSRLRYIRGIR